MKSKICNICKELVLSLWNHKHKIHNDITDHEFLKNQLNLKVIPTCPECGKLSSIDYSHYKFRLYCSKSCQSKTQMRKIGKSKKGNIAAGGWKAYHEKFKSVNPELYKKQRIDSAMKLIDKYGGWFGFHKIFKELHPKEYNEHITALHKFSSKVESYLFNKITKLFPRYNVISQYKVGKYSIDIYITNLNLAIEVDGFWCHDIKSDIIRDEFIISKLNCNIRRLDTGIIYNLSDQDIYYLIQLNSIKLNPYYERFDLSQIIEWKYDINLVTCNKLLTWRSNEKTNNFRNDCTR